MWNMFAEYPCRRRSRDRQPDVSGDRSASIRQHQPCPILLVRWASTENPARIRPSSTTGPDAADRAAAEVQKLGHDISDGVCAVGDAQAIAATVAHWAQAGSDTVILEPTPDEPDLVGFFRFIAEQVRPLIP